MHVTPIHVAVKPEHIEDFIKATPQNHEVSIQERGNRRFDVLQSPDKPEQFVLYETYTNAADAAAHKETGHYLACRDAVTNWMAAPCRGLHYTGLLLED